MGQFVKREFSDPELDILTRIANSMPCKKMKMGRVDTIYGPLYMAWGKDEEGCFHGLWGTCGIAMPIEFKSCAKESEVRQVLEMSASNTLQLLEQEGLIA